MASIANIKFSAKKTAGQDDWWTFEVTYDAYFTSTEIANKEQYYDQFQIREEDTFEDDPIDWSTHGSFYATSSLINRKLTHDVTEYQLDTEWGSEQIYIIVSLKNVKTGNKVTGQSKTILSLPV